MKIKAYAKVNIFLKILAKRGNYHELMSRFVRVDSLYDELSLEEKKGFEEFELVGDFTCEDKDNTIFKVYNLLKKQGFKEPLEELFSHKSLHVKKNIPSFAGLGGGSSDAAGFLSMCNEVLELGLSQDELAKIGLKIGADVPFFIYGYESANVGGIGEIVEPFCEKVPSLEVFTPDIQCSTAEVFTNFSSKFSLQKANLSWMSCSSEALLENFNSEQLNDLQKSAFDLHPELKEFGKKGYFMSGSGSSMFRIKNG